MCTIKKSTREYKQNSKKSRLWSNSSKVRPTSTNSWTATENRWQVRTGRCALVANTDGNQDLDARETFRPGTGSSITPPEFERYTSWGDEGSLESWDGKNFVGAENRAKTKPNREIGGRNRSVRSLVSGPETGACATWAREKLPGGRTKSAARTRESTKNLNHYAKSQNQIKDPRRQNPRAGNTSASDSRQKKTKVASARISWQ
jgi:hypothetical protein